ncbi:fructose permease [Lactobacillaceae bacterium Scapto_B20]
MASGRSTRTISMTSAIIYFVISLIINSAGNVLTLVSSAKVSPSFLGSAYWTAAESNLGKAILGPKNPTALFWAFFGLGLVITFLNMILVGKWSWKRLIGNICFLGPFSLLIQFFSNIFTQIFPEAHGIGMSIFYIFLNFFGVACIGLAISIYQRVNIALHPADDLMQILRFKFCNGSATKAMWLSYIPPTIMALIAALITPGPLLIKFANFGLGTVFAFLFQGSITGISDTKVFPSLKHQAIDVGTVGEPDSDAK